MNDDNKFCPIHIIDSVMGSGKTGAAINMINHSNFHTRYIYVTPLLSEVERIKTSCKEKKFTEPKINSKSKTKIDALKRILKRGRNVVTTHALFHMFDQEVIDLCYSQGYTLILDEVTDVVKQHNIGPQDLKVLLDTFVDVDEYGTLIWKEDQQNYIGQKFLEEKYLCNLKSLTLYTNSVLMWMFPIEIFKAFKESYILTYLFNGQLQKYYYDYYNLKYDYLYITGNNYDEYTFTPEYQTIINKYNYSELIHILDHEKLNRIGELDYSLTKNWFKTHEDDILLTTLKNHTYNFFNNIVKTKSNDCIWTVFSDYEKKIKGKGYTKSFIPSNAKATNLYSDRHNVAYLINKYFNPVVKHFFMNKNIEINEDLFALSEMLQVIWRSAIRNNEAIELYIPSKRMRNLLIEWMNDQENNNDL